MRSSGSRIRSSARSRQILGILSKALARSRDNCIPPVNLALVWVGLKGLNLLSATLQLICWQCANTLSMASAV